MEGKDKEDGEVQIGMISYIMLKLSLYINKKIRIIRFYQ